MIDIANSRRTRPALIGAALIGLFLPQWAGWGSATARSPVGDVGNGVMQPDRPPAFSGPVRLMVEFDCGRFRPHHPGGGDFVAAMNEAFAEGNPRRFNSRAGHWDCNFQSTGSKGWSCFAISGSGVRTLSRVVRLEFRIHGNCASFVLPGRPIHVGPGRLAINVGQSQRVQWGLRFNDPSYSTAQWMTSFPVQVAPPASRLR